MKWLIAAASIVAAWCQQVQCPDGFTAPPPNLYTGFCYRYTASSMTWNAHENECSRVSLNGQPYAGGHLATLFDANSARVVINNYCNGLNQGQSYYFIGYYCISTRYTSRTDWRWTSGLPTTWLHNSPTYLSGAEPDDAGCGLAHYSDDGPNAGRIGDWVCSRPLTGGCCEAPVVPTPSPTQTPSNTPTATSTQTGSRTQTASTTQTSTQTGSQTQTPTTTATTTETRTATKTATESRTASRTETSTQTETATTTLTETSSVSVSPSLSTSSSPSESISASVSSSATPSMSISQTTSNSITPTPRPIFVVGGLTGNGNVSAALLIPADQNVDSSTETTSEKYLAAIIVAPLLAILAALCAIWLFCILRKKKRREQRARAKLNNSIPQKFSRQPIASVASTLGVYKPTTTIGMRSMLNTMNPALLQVGGTAKAPRMSIALAAYRSPTAFKPMPTSHSDNVILISESENNTIQDEVINSYEEVDKEREGTVAEEGPVDANEEREETVVEEVNEEVSEEDIPDEDEEIAHITPNSMRTTRIVNPSTSYTHKIKKPPIQAAAPSTELKQIVIGKGAVYQEKVEKQIVKLRRVSKIKGDKELSATRSRPSMMLRSGYTPQSSRNLLNPYEFTATVARTIIKKEES